MARAAPVLVVAAAMLAAACSGEPARGIEVAWEATGIRPVAQPELAGERILVVLGAVGDDLTLYGLDAASGSVQWMRQASPGGVVTGIPVLPTVFGPDVAYFRPESTASLWAHLVVADAATGRDRWVSEPMFFHSHPRLCDRGPDLCLSATDEAGSPQQVRFDRATGAVQPEAAGPGGLPPGSRAVGAGLIEHGTEPEEISGHAGGAILWTVLVAEVFSPSHSTDQGWHFVRYRPVGAEQAASGPGTVVGSVGSWEERDGERTVDDLARNITVGLDAATGARRWREEGTALGCWGPLAVERRPAEGGGLWPVRCRYAGRAVVTGTGDERSLAYEGLDVTVEGFDVHTGATTWAVHVGAAERLVPGKDPLPVAGPTQRLLDGPGGPMVLDVATGRVAKPRADQVVWCVEDAFITYRVGLRYGDRVSHTWRGGELAHPCDLSGRPGAALPALLPGLGAEVGGTEVVASPSGLVAYRARPAP